MRYEPFLSLDIRHDYFGKDQVPVTAKPDGDTAALFHKAGLLFRPAEGRADVFAPDDRSTLTEFAEGGMLSLVFRLYPGNADLTTVTDLIDLGRGRVFVLDPGPRTPGPLHDGERIGEADLRELRPDDLITARDVMRPPLAILRLRVPPDARDAEYTVHFGASARFWTYYILGGDPDVTFSIRDTAGQISFADTGARMLANGHKAASFRSSDPIEINLKPKQRFELMGDGPFGPRVILPVLPAAAPGSLRIDPDGPEPGSEIYVNVT